MLEHLRQLRFREEIWPGYLVESGALERLGDLAALPGKLEELIDERSDVSVWGRPSVPTFRPVAHHDALHFYAAGYSLYVLRLERAFESVATIAAQLETYLRFPPGSITAQIFASPRGGAVPPHFDYDFNINVQLWGRKKWRVAPPTVAEPTRGYVAGEAPIRQLRDCGMRSPQTMPAHHEEIAATPGTLVAMPRGTWHATFECDHSVSLVFAVRAPTRAQVVAKRLRRQLTPGDADIAALAAALTSDSTLACAPAEVSDYAAAYFAARGPAWRGFDHPGSAQVLLTQTLREVGAQPLARELLTYASTRLRERDAGLVPRRFRVWEGALAVSQRTLGATSEFVVPTADGADCALHPRVAKLVSWAVDTARAPGSSSAAGAFDSRQAATAMAGGHTEVLADLDQLVRARVLVEA